MIAEDYEMIPVIRTNQTLLGVITRRDVMDRISKVQFSSLPTFSEQIGQKIQAENDHYQFTVEPSMLEKSGVFGQWGHDRSADEGCSQDDATQWA